MRFKQFILEEKSEAEEIAKFILENCQEHLSKFKDQDMWRGIKKASLESDKHGTIIDNESFGTKYSYPTYLVKNVRKDRRASNSNEYLTKTLDEFFKDHFGIKARSEALFCDPRYATARSYSKFVYSIFAIGKVDYLWSKLIKDAFISLDDDIDEDVRPFFINALRTFKDDKFSKDINFIKLQKIKDDSDLYDEYKDYKRSLTGRKLELEASIINSMLNRNANLIYNFNKNIKDNDGSEVMLICDSYIAVHQDIIENVRKFL